jgi:transcription initiation factor TFIIIB Brf1 subunit/transcription initiation factor TFIIB
MTGRFPDPFWKNVNSYILTYTNRLQLLYIVQDRAMESMTQLQRLGAAYNARKDARTVAAALVYLAAKSMAVENMTQNTIAKAAKVCNTALSVTSREIKMRLKARAHHLRESTASAALMALQAKVTASRQLR